MDILLESYKDLIDLIVRRPNADDLARTVPLAELIDMSKLNIRDLPKQSKIDPVFKLIQSKILRQIHLPTSFRDLHGAYLNSPHFSRHLFVLITKQGTEKCQKKGADHFHVTGLHVIGQFIVQNYEGSYYQGSQALTLYSHIQSRAFAPLLPLFNDGWSHGNN